MNDPIQRRFEDFHAKHPEVYAKIVELARFVKSRGRKQYGIKSLFEQVRWHFTFEALLVDPDEFKLNNNYTSRYARLIMERESDLKGFFLTREINTGE
jgi:hypothetical protein